MKKFFSISLVIVMGILSAVNISAASPKKVAVYVEGDLSANESRVASSSALSRISGNKNYTCFERNEDFVNAMMKEQDYQLSGEVSEKEIRKIGERFGVDYVIAIVVTSDDESTFASARLLNLETGQVLKSVSSDREGSGIKVIKPLVNNVTYRLISNTSK